MNVVPARLRSHLCIDVPCDVSSSAISCPKNGKTGISIIHSRSVAVVVDIACTLSCHHLRYAMHLTLHAKLNQKKVAWLFNIRGSDISFNPVAFSAALLTLEDAFLFIDSEKLGEDVKQVSLCVPRVFLRARFPHLCLLPPQVFVCQYMMCGIEDVLRYVWFTGDFIICLSIK